MKIVIFTGGVGIQLFQYQLYAYLRSKGYTVCYKDETMSGMSHYGFELEKYFRVDVQPLSGPFYWMMKCFWHFFPQQYEASKATDRHYSEDKLFFAGYWLDKRFYSTAVRFKELTLSNRNWKLLEEIRQTDSISIHVRRGDYLQPQSISRFSGICTEAYYQHAIDRLKSEFKHPVFYVFSDDIEWCKEHLQVPDARYIDWNTGTDSIYDMFLMSKCKANIIANSAFSYWAGRISGNIQVVYPKRWFADLPAPDIFPIDWIGIG